MLQVTYLWLYLPISYQEKFQGRYWYRRLISESIDCLGWIIYSGTVYLLPILAGVLSSDDVSSPSLLNLTFSKPPKWHRIALSSRFNRRPNRPSLKILLLFRMSPPPTSTLPPTLNLLPPLLQRRRHELPSSVHPNKKSPNPRFQTKCLLVPPLVAAGSAMRARSAL